MEKSIQPLASHCSTDWQVTVMLKKHSLVSTKLKKNWAFHGHFWSRRADLHFNWQFCARATPRWTLFVERPKCTGCAFKQVEVTSHQHSPPHDNLSPHPLRQSVPENSCLYRGTENRAFLKVSVCSALSTLSLSAFD